MNRIRSHFPAILCTLGLVLCSGCLSYSPGEWAHPPDPQAPTSPAEPETVMGQFPTVTVTARRHPDDAFDVPFAASHITGEQIRNRRLSRTLPEALKEEPGVSVQKTGHGQGSPKIRGFTGFHTLLLIDGIRLNNSVMRSGNNQYWNTVDPLTVERLELVRGPGSVLYGSDAIGGTVNAITREATIPVEGAQLARRAFYRYATAEDSHTGRLEIDAGFEDTFGLLAGGGIRDFGNLRGGKHVGKMDNTGYNEQDGDLKITLFPTDKAKFIFAYQRVDQNDAPRTHSTVAAEPWRNLAIGTDLQRDLDQRRSLAYAQMEVDEPVAGVDHAKISLSYQVQQEEERRVRANGRRRRQGFTVDTLGLFAQLGSDTDLGRLTYGFEYYRDSVSSFFKEWNANGSLRAKRTRGPVADDARYDLLGLFVQDEFNLCDDLEVTTGVRFNYSRVNADKVDPDPTDATAFAPISEQWDSVVGSGRLVYHATEAVNFFTGVSQGFRSPNLSDLTRFDASRSGEIETPATGLEPEKFIAYEAGVKAQSGPFSGQAAYFYTDIRDMIIRFPTGLLIDGDPEVTKDNVGDGFVHGVELSAALAVCAQVILTGSFAWTEGEVDTFTPTGVKERKPFNSVPPMEGTLGARWESDGFWIEGLARMVDEQRRLSPRDAANTSRIPPGGVPGYTVFTLRGGAQIHERMRVTIAVENLTDKDYRLIDSGLNEPGRNLIVAIDADL